MAQPSLKIVPQEDSAAGTQQALYEVRRAIYPRAVRGWFAAWRWALVWATQLVFYGAAWLTWNGRQAMLFDIAHRKFYVFGLVFWPQDIIYLTALLIVSALALFLFTAVAGRLWCGYACPQTVYTEIFLWIEKKIEGDRSARIRLDGAGLSLEKFLKKSTKHLAWIAFALWTGFTFVGYFTPIRELWGAAMSLLVSNAGAPTPALGPWETFWVLFYGFATYGNAGWMREQVCIYMCPYARFQSAMFDKDTLIITYDRERGEARGPRAKKIDARALGLGDCVDCGICVQVCPTGIDIRDGLQYQCIGCAACIDGCDQVMDRMGYARGLIRYSTTHAIERKLTREQMFRRALRPRVLVYTGILVAIIGAVALGLALRVPLKVDVIRDRAAIAREVGGGRIENVYRLQIMNTAERERVFELSAAGLPTLQLASEARVQLGPAESRMVPVRLRLDPVASTPGTHRIHFSVRAADSESVSVREKSVFIVR
ncbi:MAG: cytochrome c oxidase accessory protein CcoG [Betaproteobacteria bacterium]|nr:cytochrome c oxidase accessory protein CcoG [Betaproteobacteria bacterium]